jgi:hypothetical protein
MYPFRTLSTVTLARGRLSEYLEALANGDLLAWGLLVIFILFGGRLSWRRCRRRFW